MVRKYCDSCCGPHCLQEGISPREVGNREGSSEDSSSELQLFVENHSSIIREL